MRDPVQKGRKRGYEPISATISYSCFCSYLDSFDLRKTIVGQLISKRTEKVCAHDRCVFLAAMAGTQGV